MNKQRLFILIILLPAIIYLLATFLAAGNFSKNIEGRDPYLERAIQILREVPLIDGHNDVPWQYRARADNNLDKIDFHSNTSLLDPPMHTDIPRLRKGGVGGIFWSVYVPVEYQGDAAVFATLEQIDLVYQLTERYSDIFEFASTAEDIVRIHSKGKIASLIGMEGGHSINNSLAPLRQFYKLGARYMTLTHSGNTDWADSATDDLEHGGLTDFGREVIREMNRIGMLVDLSHVSPETMHDALDVTRAPVIFSHSSVRTLTNHVRNVPDDVLKRLPDNGGIVMVTFVPSFVSEEVRGYWTQLRSERARIRDMYPDEHAAFQRKIRVWQEENPAPVATLNDVADHIDYIRDLIGIEYIGIGSDFDGIPTVPEGLEDVSTFPHLLAELFQRGYSQEDIKKIAGLNLLRVMHETERIAEQLQLP